MDERNWVPISAVAAEMDAAKREQLIVRLRVLVAVLGVFRRLATAPDASVNSN